MSLTKQLWIAIFLMMLGTLGGTFVISTFSAKQYLEEQLSLKNMDNAGSLALSISQMEKDPAILELMLSAQFDSGHYQFIRIVAPSGAVLVERVNPPMPLAVPGWFPRLVPLRVEPASAAIQDGWHLFGTLSLQSHSRFAYETFWEETQRLLYWFLSAIFICCSLGTLLLKWITRPLGLVVEQAEAIGIGRFIRIEEPRTLEFRSVASAMNRLSGRVKAMLAEEASRLEKLRLEAHYDSVTGLLNRRQFLKEVDSVLSHEDVGASGALLIARFTELVHLNQTLGRQRVDGLLKGMGEGLNAYAEEQTGWVAGRLNGTDFALLASGSDDAHSTAQEVAKRLHLAMDNVHMEGERLLPVSGCLFGPGETLSKILARTDNALSVAEHKGDSTVVICRTERDTLSFSDQASWRSALTRALEGGDIKLAQYPVADASGKLLHFESPARIFIDGAWRTAAVVIPWAARLGLLPLFDTMVVRAALKAIGEDGAPLGVNISPEALCDAGFRKAVSQMLRNSPELAAGLWLEVPEHGAYRRLEEFRLFCNTLKPLGCRIGMEHVGHNFSRISELHDLGLDYIKVDAAFIRDVDGNPDVQNILRGLCTIAHTIGLTVIAEGVLSEEEMSCLPALGLDGMTGPAVPISSEGR